MKYEALLAMHSKEALASKAAEASLEERELKNAQLMAGIEQIKLSRDLGIPLKKLFLDYI